ncbi:sialic acid-binding Ig-like lectin 14 [Pteropus vampyrus]|uniref:Sialic acid-binding Ig-like lectin 14 n=1 Tax=Pteropus vampyrus TaxID=132908 RepID=A0A6P3RMT0_PTEVA|nr:sialic acid-binding Ig-like lectin 14 [Pteropus vampyrus]
MVPLLLLPLLWGGSLQDNSRYELRVQKSVTVQEGLCVVVPCSFSYPSSAWRPPAELYVYWYLHGPNTRRNSLVATNDPTKAVSVETQGRFHLLGDPMTNNCSLSIRDARKSDSGNYFFRVERGYYVKYNYHNETLDLQVTVLTEKPDIRIPEGLESGRPTLLTCSLPGYCGGGSLSFSWAGAALGSLKPQTLLTSSVLTLTPKPTDHGTDLTCQIKRQGNRVITERTVRLNVFYAPALTVRFSQGNCTALKTRRSHLSLLVLEGQFLCLVCEADSNPPATLSWSQDGKALSPSQPSAPGVLELPHVESADGGAFTCWAQHPLGSQNISLSLPVQRSPTPCRCEPEEQQGSWPVVLTVIRGALMGAGFLLTYGLTWIYYTR